MWTSVLAWLTGFFTEKVATRIIILGVFVALTTAMVTGLNTITNTIVVSAPSFMAIPLTWLYPTNADECVAVYTSALLVRWFYDANVKALSFK